MRCSECHASCLKDTKYNPDEPGGYAWICSNDSCLVSIERQKRITIRETVSYLVYYSTLLMLLGLKVLFWIWFIRMVVAK